MCYGCWEEEGKPQIATIEVGTLAMLLQGASEFGALHIFVGDWNCDDEHLKFCRDHDEADEGEKALCEMALLMSYEERVSALALADNYWGAHDKNYKPL